MPALSEEELIYYHKNLCSKVKKIEDAFDGKGKGLPRFTGEDRLDGQGKRIEKIKHKASTNYERRVEKVESTLEICKSVSEIDVTEFVKVFEHIKKRVEKKVTEGNKKEKTKAWQEGYLSLGELKNSLDQMQDHANEGAYSYSDYGYSDYGYSDYGYSDYGYDDYYSSDYDYSGESGEEDLAEKTFIIQTMNFTPTNRMWVLDDAPIHLQLEVTARIPPERVKEVVNRVLKGQEGYAKRIDNIVKKTEEEIEPLLKRGRNGSVSEDQRTHLLKSVDGLIKTSQKNVEAECQVILQEMRKKAKKVVEDEIRRTDPENLKWLLRQSRVRTGANVAKNMFKLTAGVILLALTAGLYPPAYRTIGKAINGLRKELMQQFKEEKQLRRDVEKQLREFLSYLRELEKYRKDAGWVEWGKAHFGEKLGGNKSALKTSYNRYRENLTKFDKTIAKLRKQVHEMEEDHPGYEELRDSYEKAEALRSRRLTWITNLSDVLARNGIDDLDLGWVDTIKARKKEMAKGGVGGGTTVLMGLKTTFEVVTTATG